MAGLENRNKKPGSVAGFLKRLAAFTATHAAIKTNLFRAEKPFLKKPSKSKKLLALKDLKNAFEHDSKRLKNFWLLI